LDRVDDDVVGEVLPAMSHQKITLPGSRNATWAYRFDKETTATTANQVLGVIPLPQAEGTYIIAVRVGCRRRTSNSEWGGWHFTAYCRRNCAGAELAQLTVGDAYGGGAGTVTMDDDADTIRILITPAHADARDWGAEASVFEVGTS
jgi:hypothetical protein